MYRRARPVLLWLARKSYWWVEFDPAEDAAFRAGINAKCDEPTARQVLRCVGVDVLSGDITEEVVVREVAACLLPDEHRQSSEDLWLSVMEKLQAKYSTAEEDSQPPIRDLMNLLNAYNRERETKKHRELASQDPTSTTGHCIRGASDYCERQLSRMTSGVACLPRVQPGVPMPWPEMVWFFLTLFAILAINCGDAIYLALEEYIGFARSGVQRPRTLYQTVIAVFWFGLADGWFLWEIGRQRSLGSVVSFVLFLAAAICRPIYRKAAFIISSGIASALFQIVIQLGDLAWDAYKRLKVGREARPHLSWPLYLCLLTYGRLPDGSAEDRATYEELQILNVRSVAWARGFRKSKPMSILWMVYAKARATPRNVFAARVGLKMQRGYDLAFWQKVAFPILTSAIWTISAYATWRKWYTFTSVNAFNIVAFLKGLDIAFSPEQEVQGAASTFCNMVGAGIPTLFGVMVPAAANRSYLDHPRELLAVTVVIFFATFWTDLIAEAMMKLAVSCVRKG